ncbi:MAG: cyclic nucleotide-binding domain-containing protein [Prochlorotrichaceae cyanobacterium]|jgi:CRP/FNR family cyclic AMP-dependent transcriptional regulator
MGKGDFILGALDEADVSWFRHHGKLQELPPDMDLICEGQELDTFYIVMAGALAVCHGEKELARLRVGEILGEMSFVDARSAAATVRTLEPSLILSVPQHRLSVQLQDNPGFAARFYRAIAMFLSSRLRSTVIQFGIEDG